jgi:hypothetical protein
MHCGGCRRTIESDPLDMSTTGHTWGCMWCWDIASAAESIPVTNNQGMRNCCRVKSAATVLSTGKMEDSGGGWGSSLGIAGERIASWDNLG